jgi:hypothetical protein
LTNSVVITSPIGTGDGSSVARSVPVIVDMSPMGSRTVSKLSVSMHTAQVLTTDGLIFAFGDNRFYQVHF